MADIRSFFGGKKADSSSLPPKTAKPSINASPQKISVENKEIKQISKEVQSCTVPILPDSDLNQRKVAETIGSISWFSGESVPYAALVETFDLISKAPGRLDKESLFCKLFLAVIRTTPADLDAVVHLASNSLGAAYEGLELGIGDSLLVKAICEG